MFLTRAASPVTTMVLCALVYSVSLESMPMVWSESGEGFQANMNFRKMWLEPSKQMRTGPDLCVGRRKCGWMRLRGGGDEAESDLDEDEEEADEGQDWEKERLRRMYEEAVREFPDREFEKMMEVRFFRFWGQRGKGLEDR